MLGYHAAISPHTQGQYLSQRSPIEQQRGALQQTMNNAQAQLESAKTTQLQLSNFMGVSKIAGNVSPQAIHQATVDAAQAALTQAQTALEAFESQHPQDPQLAARIIPDKLNSADERNAAPSAKVTDLCASISIANTIRSKKLKARQISKRLKFVYTNLNLVSCASGQTKKQ